jgi:3-isopropylmalate/(R)-2-methylmalate dehydratase small subunit
MNWLWRGRAWVFGDNIPNDGGLMALRFVREQQYDPRILAKHCFAEVDPGFAASAQPGDFVVAGKNFAYGNAHVQGFLGLKGLRVALLAESMSRGPYRCAVNAGVPFLTPLPGITAAVSTSDELEVDFLTGRVSNLTRRTEVKGAALPPVLREIIGAGGGIDHMRQRLGLLAASR